MNKTLFIISEIAIVVIILSSSLESYGQQVKSSSQTSAPYFEYGKGLGITSPDSLFKLNIRFRIQNRLAFTSLEDWNIDEVEARIRRLRLRFDGFIYSPRLAYVLQLGFSRSDMDDGTNTGEPSIIRDAMIVYSINKRLSIGLGQSKLPGNRQRVVSSGDLQFADRSIVNSTFNIDRDFGIQVYYNNYIRNFYYVLRGAISSGEGRNSRVSDTGLAYTGRMELLPFGPFTDGGDYFEGDLAREPKPKLSLGVTFSENIGTIRSGGQIGTFLFESRDIATTMTDLLIKYQGWALSSEFIFRNANDPITTNGEGLERYVYNGNGENYQISYLLRKNYELGGRYSKVNPNQEIQALTPRQQVVTMVASKYIRGHRLKLQTDLSYIQTDWLQGTNPNTSAWQWRLQIEAGI